MKKSNFISAIKGICQIGANAAGGIVTSGDIVGGNCIVVNGERFEGSTVEVRNDGVVFIDGERKTGTEAVVNITIEGHCESVSTSSGNIEILGDMMREDTTIESVSGDITIQGDVQGDVETVSGDVHCLSINGKVKTISGDIGF